MLGEQAIRCAALQNEAEFARLWLVMAKQAEDYIHNPVLTVDTALTVCRHWLSYSHRLSPLMLTMPPMSCILFIIPILQIRASLVAQPIKNPPAMQEDSRLIPGSGRSPGEGIGYPLRYSGLENSMDCIVHGVTKSWI